MSWIATWIEIEIIILGEVGLKVRQIPQDITYMWKLKYDANESIYKMERDSQTYRTDLELRRGIWERDGLGVWDQYMQTSIYRIDKQDPTA